MEAVSWSEYLYCYRALSVQQPQTENVITNLNNASRAGRTWEEHNRWIKIKAQ